MKIQLLLLLFALVIPAFSALDELPRGLEEAKKKGAHFDLQAIKDRGFIRVLTRNNPACYFIHRGQLMGFEYEMTHRFAKKHGIEVLVVVPDKWSDMGKWLKEGRADVIAACVTITADRWDKKQNLEYGHHYGEVYEMIVSRSKDKSINTLADLKGRTIHVRKSSSYYETLRELQKEKKLHFEIQLVPEDEETFEIIDKVAEGKYDLTCVDHNFLNQSIRLGEKLKVVLKLNRPRSYGWIVRSNQPELKKAINTFFDKEYKSTAYNMIYKSYFELDWNKKLEESFDLSDSGQISPYDDLVKKYATEYNFPWTLICSLMYQESSFKAGAVSWSGAQGLMQLMPPTAREVGVKDPFDPAQSIRGGTYYLKKQYRRVPDEVNTINRACFALASYNGGYGHLIDARKLAQKKGRDPNIWVDNVDYAYSLLSKPYYAKRAKYGYCRSEEIIDYVRKIMSRYIAYDDLQK